MILLMNLQHEKGMWFVDRQVVSPADAIETQWKRLSSVRGQYDKSLEHALPKLVSCCLLQSALWICNLLKVPCICLDVQVILSHAYMSEPACLHAYMQPRACWKLAGICGVDLLKQGIIQSFHKMCVIHISSQKLGLLHCHGIGWLARHV